MKTKSILLFVVLSISSLIAGAANFKFLPYTVRQPDGVVINCFVSGDEYFNWLHDKDGYTIIQADDGYYYWGITSGDNVVPTTFRADNTNPVQAGLARWAKISQAKYNQRKAFYAENVDESVRAPHTGTMNNLVVYIRFHDDTEFTTTRQVYDNKFNPQTGNSLKSYFYEASYSTFTISSTHYPACALTTNLSYQDSHNRSYFEPYNATTNPNGYTTSNKTQREHTLLRDAINWINANSPVPTGLNIDGDNDGMVDNVNFIIRGGNGAWADLLWGHRWVLYTYNVYINGKRVYDYTFEPESQSDVNTLCHEMFHALGAPDLYHYTSNGISPAGAWDIMDGGSGSMTSYMKWKYTDNAWIASMPEITQSGTYTLHPMASSSVNNCYTIASPYSFNEFFVVEYRKKTGTFENNLPGSGLIVYRIDPTENGNAGGPPDELYIYRPGGTLVANGSPGIAHFSSNSGRTKINDETDPSSFLQDGSPGGLDISNVTSADTTISFTVNIIDINNPTDFTATPLSSSEIKLTWHKNPSNNNVVIAYNTVSQFGTPVNGATYTQGGTIPGGGYVIYNGPAIYFNHTGLLAGTHYYYKAWSVLAGNSYSLGLACDAVTVCESITTLPFYEDFETNATRPDCWVEDGTDLPWHFFTGNGPGPGAGYPATARSGIRNACLLDMTSASNISTLITPMIDVTGYPEVQLKFWMYMQKWAGRQDELKVQYRTSPGNAWNLLHHYNQSISTWTEQTIIIPSGVDQFQLGFEGNAKFGFGICIDDIQVDIVPGVGIGDKVPVSIQVSPNPAQGLVRVSGGRGEDLIREVSVFDCTGKSMAVKEGNGEKEFNIDLSFASPGIYILKIKTESALLTRKLILTK